MERGIPQFHQFSVPKSDLARVRKEHASALEQFPGAIRPLNDSASVSVHVTDQQTDLSSYDQTGVPVVHLTPRNVLMQGPRIGETVGFHAP